MTFGTDLQVVPERDVHPHEVHDDRERPQQETLVVDSHHCRHPATGEKSEQIRHYMRDVHLRASQEPGRQQNRRLNGM